MWKKLPLCRAGNGFTLVELLMSLSIFVLIKPR